MPLETTDSPQFSRKGTHTELRGECPTSIVDMLDAYQLGHRDEYPTRMALVNEILGKWAAQQRHALSVMNRVLSGNPTGSESTVEEGS